MRVGHGLALRSGDWSRFANQPADEVLDDLLWARSVLRTEEEDPSLIMLVERVVEDLLPQVHPKLASTTINRLNEAWAMKFERDALERVGFLRSEGNVLSFPDYEPVATSHLDEILVAMLESREETIPTLEQAADGIPAPLGSRTLDVMRDVMADVYATTVTHVISDLRWRGVTLEVCPTSNVLVGGVRGFQTHPVGTFAPSGLRFAVGSDDPSLFHTWAGEENRHVLDAKGVTPGDLRRSKKHGLQLVAPGLSRPDEIIRDLDLALAQLEEKYPQSRDDELDAPAA